MEAYLLPLVLLAVVGLAACLAILERRIASLQQLVNFAFDRLAAPVTPEHIATLAQGIQEGNASLLGAIAATTEGLLETQAARDSSLRLALRAYEQSHAQTTTQTVNGFTHVDTIQCNCALCSGARAALG